MYTTLGVRLLCRPWRKSRAISLQFHWLKVKVVFTGICIRLQLPSVLTPIFDFCILFRREILTNIERGFVCDTEVVTFARFSAHRTVVVDIKRKTEVSAFRRPWFRTSLVGRHIYAIKRIRARKRGNNSPTKN